jgi:DNA-binding XRE family transcriptional regulator
MVIKRRSWAQARKAAGYTQESLAERLGVDRTTVARWEAGEYQPQPWQRPRIAEAFGLSLGACNELLDESDATEGVVGVVEVSASSVEVPVVPDAARTLLNELAVTTSVSGITWEEFMRWLSRREVLKHGLAATVLPVLGMDNTATIGAPGYAVEEPSVLAALSAASWASPIYEAVLSPTDAARHSASELEVNAEGQLGSPADLRRTVATAMQASLASDYARLAQLLPRLIGQTELANLQARDADRLTVQRLLSDVYATAGWALIKADSPVVAWVATQRAIQFAEQADDMLRGAAATRCLAEVHMRAKSLHEASRTAFLAATYLDTAQVQEKGIVHCLRGAALLSAAAASARRGDPREAYTALKAAEVCTVKLHEERCDLGTVFGPTNVAIHQVAVAVELGDAAGAMRHVPKVNLDRMPSQLTERRARFLIDVARSYTQLRDDTAALDVLLQAEAIAPDEVRNHRLTHEVLRELLPRERRSSGLRELVTRCKQLH